jgi:UDP-N-acetylmuramate dehydrogenase
MEIIENQSLKSFNTFGLEVSCRWFVEANSISELKEILSDKRFKNIPLMVLGGGSNVLFRNNFDGLVIHNIIDGIKVIEEDDQHVFIKSGAGVVWNDLVQYTIGKNYPGLENLSLIPGSVGAAPIQNIGAYGVEMKRTFYELTAYKIEDGTIHRFDSAECKFGYRDSIFKREAKNKFIITDVTFRLEKQNNVNTTYGAIKDQLNSMHIDHPTIRDVSEAVIAIRRSKLPDPKEIGNAGSFFKNPEIPEEQFEDLKKKYNDIVGYPASPNKIKVAAGWLIEKAGWKGKRIGNVGMHEKQALVLVNYGNATGDELVSHALKVQGSVREMFGVEIEMEVNVIY